MDEERVEWVEQALRESERRQGIAKVLSMESKNAVAKGTNFMGDIQRLKLEVVNGAGELECRSAIYKGMPTSEMRRYAAKKSGFFSNEARVYNNVFPEMKKLLNKQDPLSDILWPVCYGIKGRSEGFLLEDLTAIGYKMGERLKGLDFDHASLVMDALAKFHALSAVLMLILKDQNSETLSQDGLVLTGSETDDLTLSDFGWYYFAKGPEIVQILFTNNLKALAETLEENWKGEWVNYARKVRDFRDTFPEKLTDSFSSNTCKLKVLNHGDCWLSNMLFKYDKKGQPQQVRFLDFQLCYVGAPGSDLQYFFATSLRADNASPRKRELLELYHAALDDYLQQFGYRGERLSLEELVESYEHFATFGVACGLAIRPMTMMQEADVPDLETKSAELAKGDKIALSFYHYEDEHFVNALKFTLKEGEAVGVL